MARIRPSDADRRRRLPGWRPAIDSSDQSPFDEHALAAYMPDVDDAGITSAHLRSGGEPSGRRTWSRAAARAGRSTELIAPIAGRQKRHETFRPAVLSIRWGTTAVSVALATGGFAARDWTVVAWCGAIAAYTIFRTVQPIELVSRLRTTVSVIGEVAIVLAAVVMTGGWDSAFVFSLLTAVIVAGFARGFGFALRIGAVAGLTVSTTSALGVDPDTRAAIQWTVMLLLVALIAGYARRISGEADRRHTLALDRMERLTDANSLLYSLHRIAQTLPASLDMKDVLDTTISRLRGLFDFDFLHVLLFDDTDARWQVLRREGAKGPDRLGPTELPAPLKRAIAQNSLVEVADLSGRLGPGMTPASSSGMYAALLTRGSLIGLLAIEHREPGHFSERDVDLLSGFVEPVGLAIDNARWFGRLRTVGADEERTRIARDLHDRIGQALAYLGFELDRIIQKDRKRLEAGLAGDGPGEGSEEISDSLARLREDVRSTIREVRDTLYDLRTDVSDAQDLPEVLEAFAVRLRERTDLNITIDADATGRLPILREREMWRLAQEAMVNVERHAEADSIIVRWRYDGTVASIEITDDGKGFPEGKAGRVDSYGIMGMRERAASIGAQFEVESAPGEGTTIRCVLGQQPSTPEMSGMGPPRR